ncbi:hypothetical protein C8R45DRAFT_1089282 [Mycena sanguinolenta]|nr:hypothetical protein C8R45DRAFT_1089282 [Mycena sanguinolenta]
MDTRSGNCPLPLNLAGPTTSPVLTQFIETLVAHCGRWEHLERHLTFGPIELRHDVRGAPRAATLQPALRHLTLTSCFLNATVILPWAQLTHLDAHCLYEHTSTNAPGTYCAAPLLVTCTLSVCCSDDDK